MNRDRLATGLLLLPALIVAAVESCILRPAGALLDWLHRVPVMQRMHRRLAALPPGVALPLFLVPEAASRAATLAASSNGQDFGTLFRSVSDIRRKLWTGRCLVNRHVHI